MTAETSGGGGGVAAKRAKVSDDNAAGEDRLSALHDDVLVLILLRLYTEDAVRTSVLSHRWRRVWTLLPELRFSFINDSRYVSAALSDSEVPLRVLHVGDPNSSPESLAAWLPAAARRVSGELLLLNLGGPPRTAANGEASGPPPDYTFELPCFDKATSICIDIGHLGLSMPTAGVFGRLTDLSLSGSGGRFHGPGDLGDAVSSPRCPCLQKLAIRNVLGLHSVAITSQSLQQLHLDGLRGVRQLTVVAPTLKDFGLLRCFIGNHAQPLASIQAPQLNSLKWVDSYHPSSVHLATMEHLHEMATFFFVYGPDGCTHNRACLDLLPRFRTLQHLILSLACMPELDDLEYLMEDMTTLPHVESLQLMVLPEGHAIGPYIFHVLKICSGIKHLELVLSRIFSLEEPSPCSSDCICDEPTNWKTEDIVLNHLEELEIEGFIASDHEVAFVKRLLNWVPALKMLTVTFNRSIDESKAKELLQMLSGFSRPDVCMQFFIYQNFRKVLFAPED